MALGAKAAIALIQARQKAAVERDEAEKVTIKQIKEKLIQIEQMVKKGNQSDESQKVKREELYRIATDLKSAIPKQTQFINDIKVDAARIEDFIEVGLARVFTGLGSITKGMGVITNSIKSGFIGIKNSFISISSNTINAVKGFIRNTWSNVNRFLTLDIRKQLSNVMGLITGGIRRIIGGAISLAVKGIKMAIGVVTGIIKTGFRIVTGVILGALKMAWQSIKWAIGKVWSLVSNLASFVVNFVWRSLMKVGSFILGFVWNTIKWVAGAIAGFLWKGIKSIVSTVGKTLLFMTTQLVSIIATVVMSAFGPYLAIIGGVFLIVMALSGKLGEWWNSLLDWFGFGGDSSTPVAQSADENKPGFWKSIYDWMWGGNGANAGWLKKGLTFVGDTIVKAFGLAENMAALTGNVVVEWADKYILTPITDFLQSNTFGKWISSLFNDLRRYLFGETTEDVSGDIASRSNRLNEIKGKFGGNINTLTEDFNLLKEASQLLSQNEEDRARLKSGNLNQGLVSRVGKTLSKWWLGEGLNWKTPDSASPFGSILNAIFGNESQWWNWSSEEGVVGGVNEFVYNEVYIPLVEFFSVSILPYLQQMLEWIAILVGRNDEASATSIREKMAALSEISRQMRLDIGAKSSMGSSGLVESFNNATGVDTKSSFSSFKNGLVSGRDRVIADQVFSNVTEDQRSKAIQQMMKDNPSRWSNENRAIDDFVSNPEIYNKYMNDELFRDQLSTGLAGGESLFNAATPAFQEYVSELRKMVTSLTFSLNKEYFQFDESNRLAFDNVVTSGWAKYGIKLNPDSFDSFVTNTDTYVNKDLNKLWELEKTYGLIWKEQFGTEAVGKAQNMRAQLSKLTVAFRTIFSELGEGDSGRGAELFSASGGVGFGTALNNSGWGVGTLREFVQRNLKGAKGTEAYAKEVFGFEYGGVAIPQNGGINAILAEAGDPEMVIPLNAAGAEFIIETMNRVNIGDSESNLSERLDSIDRKLKGNTPDIMIDPANYNKNGYNPVTEPVSDRKNIDFTKMIAMGIFEGKS